MYDTELILPTLLSTTADPIEADFFYIPAMPACYYHRCLVYEGSGECQRKTAEYLSYLLNWVDEHYGVFLLTNPNLLTITLDTARFFFGQHRVFHRLDSLVILSHDGSFKFSELTGFRPGHDITIPTYRNYGDVHELRYWHATNRTIAAHFRGTFKPEEPLYGHGYRTRLQELARNHTQIQIRRGHSDHYWWEMRSARYALCPEGWVPWSPRFYDALQAGAMPIILSHRWIPPYDLEWDPYIRRVSLEEMERLPEMLELEPTPAPAHLAIAVRWNVPAQPGDAFYHLLAMLDKRLKK